LLKLRRGTVVAVDPGPRVTNLRVKLEGERAEREAIAYPGLTGPVEVGDHVVVNVQAQDLGLGSGGFDILHVNLTRGLAGEGEAGTHVMKLNYTPLQHSIQAIEEEMPEQPPGSGCPVAVLALHGQLAPAVFALSERASSVGFVQTAGGALPGQLSDVVAELLDRGAISHHLTVAPCFGGTDEAITVEGALDAGTNMLSWEAAIVGPGPGILGSASALGHGGLEALHSAHCALTLGCDVVLAPRVSGGDARERHHGLSHHTRTVLALLLRPVSVAVPSGIAQATRIELEQAIARGGHKPVRVDVDDLVGAYRASGLPGVIMGRSMDEDEDFFRAALAAGAAIRDRIAEAR
jgi:hypothetical protein